MRTLPTLAVMISTMLLAAPASQAQPADPDDVLSSTEEWTDADINDDDALSQSELNRAEPTLATSFGDIDRNNDRRISRDELEAWQAGPEPGNPDADELAAGEADLDATAGPESDQVLIRDETSRDAPDDLLPDDGDKATELLPDDADDDAAGAGEVEPGSRQQ
jgi:hypothetical protein